MTDEKQPQEVAQERKRVAVDVIAKASDTVPQADRIQGIRLRCP